MQFQHRLVHRGRFLEEREPKEAKATRDQRKCMVGGHVALHSLPRVPTTTQASITPTRRGQRDWEGRRTEADRRQAAGDRSHLGITKGLSPKS